MVKQQQNQLLLALISAFLDEVLQTILQILGLTVPREAKRVNLISKVWGRLMEQST
jgi:hypothetical protein